MVNPALVKWILGGLLGIVCLAALVPLAVTWIERRQAQDLQGRVLYEKSSGGSKTVVVFFSRSGNTALAARHIAQRMDARLVELSAPDYELGLLGWGHAMKDARGKEARISPRMMDLSPFDTVYLGSPIWLYSPAPPIWEFARSNRFDGTKVVLFNTFNSQFKDEFIEELREIIVERGARSFDHQFVRRGRMTGQMSPEQMLEEIDENWVLEGASK